jgi:hypothetical protein
MPDKAKRSRSNWKWGWQGSVFRLSFQSDFTNEMDIWHPTGRAGSNGIHASAS